MPDTWRLRGRLHGSAAQFQDRAASPESFANLPRAQYMISAMMALANLHDGRGISGYLLDLGAASMLDLGASAVEKRLNNEVTLLVARAWKTGRPSSSAKKPQPIAIAQSVRRSSRLLMPIRATCGSLRH